MPLGFQKKLRLGDIDNSGGEAGRRCNCCQRLSVLYSSFVFPKRCYCRGRDTPIVDCVSARHGTPHFAFKVSSTYEDSEELESSLQSVAKRVWHSRKLCRAFDDRENSVF